MSGKVQVRSVTKIEVRAPVAGFLREVHYEEGDWISSSMVLAKMEIRDLDSKLKKKQAEVAEAQARLKLLQIGTRPEKIDDQRERVKRLQKWCDLARAHLKQQRESLDAELLAMEELIGECLFKLKGAKVTYDRTAKSLGSDAASAEEFNKVHTAYQMAQQQHKKAQAELQARKALGTLGAETELACREKDLADAEALLSFLQIGPQPEEIAAEQARLRKLKEEQCYFQQLQEKLYVNSLAAGVITTRRLKEKIGSYLDQGDIICTI